MRDAAKLYFTALVSDIDNVYRDTWTYIYTYMYTHIHTYINIHIYIYMYIHQKRHTNIVLYAKRDVFVHIYRSKTFVFWYAYVWLDTMFVILFQCLHVSFVCLFWRVHVSFDTVFVCLFWRIHISFDFWCSHVSFDTHPQPHACDACMHAIPPFFVRLLWRGGGLGSSTIFKKFNEPYAPS